MVDDARRDDRFVENPLVTGPPHIRFYAGVPLRTSTGHALGTLCVIDREPHYPAPRKIRLLETIRDAVVAQLELRRVTQATGRLHNLITMCAWCKNVRLPAEENAADEQQRWVSPLESLRDSKVVTHGVCPTCRDKMVHDA